MDKRTNLLIARDLAYRNYVVAQNEADQAHEEFAQERDVKLQTELQKEWKLLRSEAEYLRGKWQQAIAAIQFLE